MARAETQNATGLEHVRWIGGGSGSGKTTLARMLAERFACRLYSSDDTMREHSARLDPAEAPLLDAFLRSDPDERWVRRDPAIMARTFHWFHGEGFELIVEDLRRLPRDRLVLAEGFRLLPRLVQPHLSDRRHAAWLVPTPRFRREAFRRRRGPAAFWTATSDPERALANLLERDRIFTDALAGEAARADLTLVRVDGGRTPDELAAELAMRLGLSAPRRLSTRS
jgi:2-phosphoglycerate kinase